MSSIETDFTSSPDELLTAALEFGVVGGTDFTSALDRTQEVMTLHWSAERTPVVIFLLDAEDYVKDEAMKRCRKFVKAPPAKGSLISSVAMPLSFHAVSFGEESSSPSLRRMAKIALEVQNNGAKRSLHPAAANVPLS
ncbi:hypothetical protein V8E53_007548 [Lactarius tabidus]